MATKTQIEANRRNALKSTGPTTADGKAAVRLNALWHGGYARDLLLPGEDGELFQELRDSFRAHYSPSNPSEEFLLNRMILACWRLRRLATMEVRVLRSSCRSRSDLGDLLQCTREAILGTDESPRPDDDDPLATAYIRDSNGGNTLNKFARNQTALERSFYRALQEFDRLRAGAAPRQKVETSDRRGT